MDSTNDEGRGLTLRRTVSDADAKIPVVIPRLLNRDSSCLRARWSRPRRVGSFSPSRRCQVVTQSFQATQDKGTTKRLGQASDLVVDDLAEGRCFAV